ncbi:MAG: NFACT family protein [Clostridiales bacterium]|nr:NFACT family protein [Clostridiales bacterium]
MSYDGLVMNGVANECNQLLVGARVDKIAQPNRNEIILHLRNQGMTYKLLISATAQEARVHITNASPPNPGQAPVFCMVLRKHLEGGRIVAVEQQSLDRVLHINISAMDEYGDIREKRLIAEIMGKHSNLILVDPDTGRILDSMKRITEAVNRYRQVLPGVIYVPPPPSDKFPLWLEEEDAAPSRLLQAGASQALDKVILSTYDGIGPLSVQEIIHRAGFSPIDTLEYFGQGEYSRLYQSVSGLGKSISTGAYQPEILQQEGRPKDFSAIALTLYPQERRLAFPSMNEMLDVYFREKVEANLFVQRQRDIEQVIRREQERCRKKAGLQAESILEGKEADKWRALGQLLTTYFYQIEQGEEASVTDLGDPEGGEVLIPMDPRLTPMENAQVYFKRYQKARQTANKAQVFYDETMEELAYLDSLAFSLTTVRRMEELLEIRDELGDAEYLKPASGDERRSDRRSRMRAGNASSKKGKGKGKSSGTGSGKGKGGKNSKGNAEGKEGKQKERGQRGQAPAIASIECEGYQILFGANNRQNDYLNMKVAKSGDLWFHAQNIPSAHVVVRNPGNGEIPDTVVETAAKICLWHSQAKAAGRAAIDFTMRQNVWKPKGAKPGMMLYEQYQTVYITVDEEEIKEILG